MTRPVRFERPYGGAALLASLAAGFQHENPQATLDLVVARSLEVVEDADCASVTLRTRGQLQTLAATDERSRQADELQYVCGEGPCATVAHDEEWFRTGDIAADPRWPLWGKRAAELGLGSLLSVPLLSRNEPTGALTLYAAATGRFSDQDDVYFATLYATHVALAISSARTASELRTAAQSRHVIGMAQGLLMERFGLSPDQSFALLRRYSNNLNVKLIDVAEDVVGKGRLPGFPGEESPDEEGTDDQG